MTSAGVLEPAMVNLRFEALLSAHRPEEGLQLLQSQLPNHRDAPFIWFQLCRGFLALDRYAEAESAGRQALVLDPDNTGVLINLGLAVLYQGRQQEAVELALKAVELGPDDAENHYWLGVMHLNAPSAGKSDWAAALQCARTALALEAERADYYWLAASASGRLGVPEDAARHLSAGLAVDPEHRSLLMLGTQIAGGESVVGAEAQVLRSLLAKDPMDSKAHRLLRGQAYARLRGLAVLPWLQAVFFCFLAPVVPAAAVGGAVPVALFLALLVGWRSRRRYRRLHDELPGGYLEELVRSGGLTRLSRRLTMAGLLTVSAGTLGAAVAGAGAALQWALVLTVTGILLTAAGYQLLLAGEERDGQPAGSTYWRPNVRESNAVVILLGGVFSLFSLVYVDRLVFAGAALLSLAVMLAGGLLGMAWRKVIRTVSWRSVAFGAGCVLLIAALTAGGSHLLQHGGQPQPPEPEPDRVPVQIPVPTFSYSPPPLPSMGFTFPP